MAIKISGTTVIDDSRNLQNTLNVNATGNVYANTFIGDGTKLTGMLPGGETLSFSANSVVYDSSGYVTAATHGHLGYSNIQYESVLSSAGLQIKRIISYRETTLNYSKDVSFSYNSNGAITAVSIADAL